VSLLEALARIRAEVPAHLVILGREGDATETIGSAIVRLALDDHVTLVGYTPDVYHYLANASVFVFPSYMEGLGTAVLEALALGLPVVAFDIPPLREATDQGRFARLVEPGDIDGLSQALLAALEKPAAAAGQTEWIESNYRVDVVATRVEALLRQVASRG
jgi:glycosyltransferase involved in cell wall biosynthesis